MQTTWLVAMGIDPPYPFGDGSRTLLGHRVVIALRSGPKSMRQLHAATGRVVRAGALREALRELHDCGLVRLQVGRSGHRGGRPSETWQLLYPGSTAVEIARREVAAARERMATSPRAGAQPVRQRASPAPARTWPRRRRPVPRTVADAICDWIGAGHYLRDFCRAEGRPSPRTVYAWTAKDPDFRRRFQRAREFGEESIRDEYAEHLLAPETIDRMLSREGRREFHRRFIRPIDLRLQRWRKHPRRDRPRAPGRGPWPAKSAK